MVVEIVNRQRRFTVDTERIEGVASGALEAIGRSVFALTVLISNDRRLRALNRTYRGHDRPTDVLSFPYDDAEVPSGDVIISVDRAASQAAERGHSLQRELELLTLHGALHVSGYDHETDGGTMNRLERKLRRQLVP
jgi:probable rRNA maturation factor